jgi:hypothetical protein
MKIWSSWFRKMKRRQAPIYSAVVEVGPSKTQRTQGAVAPLPEPRADDPMSATAPGGLAARSDSPDLPAPRDAAPLAAALRVSEAAASLPCLPPAEPVITLSRTSHDFGEVRLGDYEFWLVSLRNQGDNEAIIREVSGLPSQGFSLWELPVLPVTIPPQGKRIITVRYAPDQAGHKVTASLEITTNDPHAPVKTVLLTGMGGHRLEPESN